MQMIRQNFYDVLAICKKQYFLILSYSIAIGILTLIIPISAQSLVNIVSYGAIIQPVIVLAIIIFILLTASSIFRIMLIIIIEIIQLKIFALIALNMAKHLTHISFQAFCKIQGTGLTNYFFEIITIQKAMARLILYSLEMVLISVLSMILLAFYHPILFMFDCVLILALVITFYFPFKRCVASAVQESTAKHKVAAWLDEISFHPTLFRFRQNDTFALSETDNYVFKYLKSRYVHFKNIMLHHIGGNIIYIVSNTALLAIGGYLVVKEQLTLGQLVATEILLSLIVSNVIKLGSHFENLYDLIAASNKIGAVFSLPTDYKITYNHNDLINTDSNREYHVEVKDLKTQQQVVPVTFRLGTHDSIAIVDEINAQRSKLIDVIAGLSTPSSGMVKYDGVIQSDYSIKELHENIFLLRNIEIFNGSIIKNILLSRSYLRNEIHYWINYFNLDETIAHLPDGIETVIHPANTLTQEDMEKIMIIRAFACKPKLLLIDGFMDSLSNHLLEKFIAALVERQESMTCIVVTNNKRVANHFTQKIIL